MLDGDNCGSDKQNAVETAVERKNVTTKQHLFDDVEGTLAVLISSSKEFTKME